MSTSTDKLRIGKILISTTPQYRHMTVYIKIATNKGRIVYRGTLSKGRLHIDLRKGSVTITDNEDRDIKQLIQKYFNQP